MRESNFFYTYQQVTGQKLKICDFLEGAISIFKLTALEKQS